MRERKTIEDAVKQPSLIPHEKYVNCDVRNPDYLSMEEAQLTVLLDIRDLLQNPVTQQSAGAVSLPQTETPTERQIRISESPQGEEKVLGFPVVKHKHTDGKVYMCPNNHATGKYFERCMDCVEVLPQEKLDVLRLLNDWHDCKIELMDETGSGEHIRGYMDKILATLRQHLK